MSDEDILTYNGTPMPRDYAESLDSAQNLEFYRVDGRNVSRLRFGEETFPMVTAGHGLCECCSAAPSQFHQPLCEREQCQICKQQVLCCYCSIDRDDAVSADH